MDVHIILSRLIIMEVKEHVINKMQGTLKIAADATRLKIMFYLLKEEKCVNDIALEINASQSLVSHQLKVLKDGEFVKSRKEGTKIYYSLKDEHVRQIMEITLEHVLEDEHHV